MTPLAASKVGGICCAIALLALPGCRTPKPQLVPTQGTYPCPVMVTITDSRSNAKIFYTTDGSLPTSTSAAYSAPFSISSSDSVRTIAIAPHQQPSPATNVQYSCAMTRAEFATILQKQYSLPAPAEPVNFPDVPTTDPAYAAIQSTAQLINLQILCPTCYIRPEFYPNAPIFDDASTLGLVRVLVTSGKAQLLSASDSAAVLARVPDGPLLPPVAKQYFATAIKSGILTLKSGEPIHPSRVQSRENVVATLGAIQKRFNLPPPGVIGVPQ
jgi:chitobiase/beta-hexosaminidase-like protein